MRADSKPQPPASTTFRKRQSGRPRYYGNDELMQVWLFVRERVARTGLSANRVCLSHELQWIVAGRGGSKRHYTIKGQTLRSLYQRAVRILTRELEEHEAYKCALRKTGASSPREAEPLPTASFWRGVLEQHLAPGV